MSTPSDFNPAPCCPSTTGGGPEAVNFMLTGTTQSFITEVTDGMIWSPPVGELLDSVTVTVLEGTVDITGSEGGAAIAAPTGFSASWSNAETSGMLEGPSVAAGAGGHAIVHYTVRTV